MPRPAPPPPEHRIDVLADLSPRQADGFLGLRRHRLRVRYANGEFSAPFDYDEVHRRSIDAVVIAAYFEREGEPWVYLRSALRPPVALRRQTAPPGAKNESSGLWELPAGLIDPGEDVLWAGARELCEELGFDVKPEALDLLGPSVLPCPGVMAEYQYFVAVRVEPSHRRQPCLDGSALEVGGQIEAVALETALSWARGGFLRDSKTELGLRRLDDHRQGRL